MLSYLTGKNRILDAFDIIIVGAGPAGLTAARYATQNGAKVLLLERDAQVGVPVRCAEGVFQSNLKEIIDIPEDVKCSIVTGVNIYAPDGTLVEMQSPEAGFVLDRVKFESHLAQLAIHTGVILKTNADVIGVKRTSAVELEVSYLLHGQMQYDSCHIVIGADGVESRIGRMLGLDTTLSLKDIDSCAQYVVRDIPIQADRCCVYFGNDVAPGGYAWVFPKSDSSANIGLGMCAARKVHKTAREYLDDFIDKYYPDGKIESFIAGGVPIAKSLPHIVNDNVMLVGDAARQTNPLTGGGIEYSMQAGKMAGITAAKAIANKKYHKKALYPYQKEWEKKFKGTQDFAYILKNKLYSATDERMNELLGELSVLPVNKLSIRALFLTVLKNHPVLLAKMAKSYFADIIH